MQFPNFPALKSLLPEPEANPWVVRSTSLDYENPYTWVEKNTVTRPDGLPGTYWVTRFRRVAVGILPVDAEGFTYLVGQYRFPTGTYEWEIPEGGAEPGESPLDCAKRELREEAGLLAENFSEILHLQISNSCTDEVSCTFLATGLTFTEAQPEGTEQLRIFRLPLVDAIEMAVQGQLRDGISVASLLKLDALMRRGLVSFS